MAAASRSPSVATTLEIAAKSFLTWVESFQRIGIPEFIAVGPSSDGGWLWCRGRPGPYTASCLQRSFQRVHACRPERRNPRAARPAPNATCELVMLPLQSPGRSSLAPPDRPGMVSIGASSSVHQIWPVVAVPPVVGSRPRRTVLLAPAAAGVSFTSAGV